MSREPKPDDAPGLRSMPQPVSPIAGTDMLGVTPDHASARRPAPEAVTPVSPPEAPLPVSGSARTATSVGAAPEGSRPEGSATAGSAPETPGATVVSETIRPSENELVEQAKEATRDRARDVGNLLVTYGKAHLPERKPPVHAPVSGPPKLAGRLGQIIPILRVVPLLLLGVFLWSFRWDFDGWSMIIPVFGWSVPMDGLLRVLSVSGLIGFLTNWVAITMLFQPRQKRAIIPQGLIPAQRERVIYRLSEAISKELINADIIKQKIQESGAIGRYRDMALGVVRGVVEDTGFRTDLRRLAGGYVHDVLRRPDLRRELTRLAAEKMEESAGQGLGGAVLKIYRSVAEDDFQRRIDKALDEIPGAVEPLLDRIDTALDAVPPKIEARSEDIEAFATQAVLGFVESLDIRSMIVEKARGFDEGQLEGLLKSTSNEQLNYIKYLGAILGVLGGLVIWQPIGSLVAFFTVGLTLWAVDEALVRARRSRTPEAS